MAFVQIIEYTTSRFDEAQALAAEWDAAAGDGPRPLRRVVCRDRDAPGRYAVVVFFESYETAMENSEHPTTQEFSRRMGELMDGPPVFRNLDVVDDTGD